MSETVKIQVKEPTDGIREAMELDIDFNETQKETIRKIVKDEIKKALMGLEIVR